MAMPESNENQCAKASPCEPGQTHNADLSNAPTLSNSDFDFGTLLGGESRNDNQPARQELIAAPAHRQNI